jgi:hypothetical protein
MSANMRRSRSKSAGSSARSPPRYEPPVFSIRNEGSFGTSRLSILAPGKQTIAYTAALHTFSRPNIVFYRGEYSARDRSRSNAPIIGEAYFHKFGSKVDVALEGNQSAQLYRAGILTSNKVRTFRLWNMDFTFKPTSSYGRGTSLRKDVKMVSERDGAVWAVFHRSGGWNKWGELEILAPGLGPKDYDAVVMMMISYLQKVKKEDQAAAARTSAASGGS